MALAAAATVLLVGTPTSAPAAPSSASAKKGRLALKRVAKGFDTPTHLAAPKGERGTLYVTEQAGRIWKLRAGKRLARPFLDISGRVGAEPEQGLLSIAFHPDYATNKKLYVNYTDARGNTRIAEYRSNGKRALKRPAKQILWVRQSLPNHNGGQIAFGRGRRSLRGNGRRRRPRRPGRQRTGRRARRSATCCASTSIASRLAVGHGRLRTAQPLALLVRLARRATSTSPTSGRRAVEEINFTPAT